MLFSSFFRVTGPFDEGRPAPEKRSFLRCQSRKMRHLGAPPEVRDARGRPDTRLSGATGGSQASQVRVTARDRETRHPGEAANRRTGVCGGHAP